MADHGSPIRIGIVADPHAPTALARTMQRRLPRRLTSRFDGVEFEVEVVSEPLSARVEAPSSVLERVVERGREQGWDIVIGLTELPLPAGGRPLAVDVSTADRAALMSIPEIGGLLLRRRVPRVVEETVAALVSELDGDAHRDPAGRLRERLVASPTAPLSSVPTDDADGADLRVVGSPVRGRIRLLLGMVKANQPWRLVPGLSKALVAALTTAAIATVNATVWMVADAIGTGRLVLACVGSIALMVTWLIVDAHLWHRPTDRSPPIREKAALYNASTVLTLVTGVVTCYAALCVINVLWAFFIVDSEVYGAVTGQDATVRDYLVLAWLVASAATVGGALGSGLESEEAIRAATYSKREQERRRELGLLDNDKTNDKT